MDDKDSLLGASWSSGTTSNVLDTYDRDHWHDMETFDEIFTSAANDYYDIGDPQRRKSRKLKTLLITVLCAVMIAAGGVLIYKGVVGETIEDLPLPERPFDVSSEQAQDLAAKNHTSDPKAAAQLARGLEDMGPLEVWVPPLNARTTLTPDETFVASNYSGLPTLRVPANPRKAVWFSAGGPLWGGKEGTTLVAAHAATRNNPGIFRGLDKLTPGDIVWTSDVENRKQAWVIRQLWAAEHRAFPQEYFLDVGERQIVITTCGGRLNRQGYYAQNVFAVGVPIEVEGSTPWVEDDVKEDNDGGDITHEDEQSSATDIS